MGVSDFLSGPYLICFPNSIHVVAVVVVAVVAVDPAGTRDRKQKLARSSDS